MCRSCHGYWCGVCAVEFIFLAPRKTCKVCARPLPVDGQSIVGRLPDAPGIYVAVTHSGVTLAAHLSQFIAAELLTGTPQEDLTPYRPARFLAAGSAGPAGPSPARYPEGGNSTGSEPARSGPHGIDGS